MSGMSNCLMDLDGSHILLDQVLLTCIYILLMAEIRKYPYSYSPLLHAGVMTVLILLAFRFFNMSQTPAEDDRLGFQAEEVGTERVPLLLHKDDDVSSWGSSYDSVSHDEEDPEEHLAAISTEGQQITEGENINNPPRLCVICFDAPRDCFFLPCGHCASCFTCATR
jgi:hypothetical protein